VKNVSHLVILGKSSRTVDSPVTGKLLGRHERDSFFLSACSVTAVCLALLVNA